MVPTQLKIFTPVGTAISMLMIEKNGSSTDPVTYMWCAQTVTDSAAMATVAKTRLLYPNTGFRLNTGNTSVTMPKNGSAMMYTSGCPKNQNKCCQSSAPPLAGLWMCARPSCRRRGRTAPPPMAGMPSDQDAQ